MGAAITGVILNTSIGFHKKKDPGDPKMRKGLLFAQRTPFREKEFYFCEKDFHYG